MRIFRIKNDSNNVQAVQPTNEKLINLEFLNFDCESRKNNWRELEVYIFNPKTTPKNFYNFASGNLVFDEIALDVFQTLFEIAGEILPLQVERGQKLYLLNVLDCRNALDYDKTVWDYYSNGSKGRILDIAFHKNRIGNISTIFKIPETSKTAIYCYTDDRNEDDQFYYLYHKHKLTGLIFEEIDNQ